MRMELQAKTLRQPYLRSAFKIYIFSYIFKTMYDIMTVRNLSAKIIIFFQYITKCGFEYTNSRKSNNFSIHTKLLYVIVQFICNAL